MKTRGWVTVFIAAVAAQVVAHLIIKQMERASVTYKLGE
jgi:hypothetical protein